LSLHFCNPKPCGNFRLLLHHGPQAKIHRKVARQVKVAKLMALAPISSRPSLQPQGQPRRAHAASRASYSTGAAAPPTAAAASTDE